MCQSERECGGECSEHRNALEEKGHDEFVRYLVMVGNDHFDSRKPFTAGDYYEAARRIEELSDEAGHWRKEAERLLQQYNRVVGRFNRLKSRVEGALNGA